MSIEIPCPVCGTHFVPRNARHKRCSPNCNLRAFRAKRAKEAPKQEQKMTEIQLALAELKAQWAEVKRQWSGVKTILQEAPLNYTEHYPNDERAPVLDKLITNLTREAA